MGRSKLAKNVEIRPWLSAKPDCKEGRFIQVGNSLLLSKKFQGLTAGARWLYQCMAMESGGKGSVEFTHGTGEKYGIPGSSYDRYTKELKAGGFITITGNEDMAQYAPSVYQFTFDWKRINSKAAPHFGEATPRNPPQNGEGKG